MKVLKNVFNSFLVITVMAVGLTLVGCSSIDAPEGIAATQGTYADKVVVTWDAVESSGLFKLAAESYTVARSNSDWIGLGIFFTLKSGVTATNYADSSVIVGNTYYYKVKAVNGDTESDFSAEYADGWATAVVSPPAAPTGVSASDDTSSSVISVSWSAVTGATSYKIYKSATADGTFAQIGTATGTTYDDSGLAADVIFYYKVSAVNSMGESALSAADAGSTSSVSTCPITMDEFVQNWLKYVNCAMDNKFRSADFGGNTDPFPGDDFLFFGDTDPDGMGSLVIQNPSDEEIAATNTMHWKIKFTTGFRVDNRITWNNYDDGWFNLSLVCNGEMVGDFDTGGNGYQTGPINMVGTYLAGSPKAGVTYTGVYNYHAKFESKYPVSADDSYGDATLCGVTQRVMVRRLTCADFE